MSSSPRFFIEGVKLNPGETYLLSDEDSHHAYKVLRLKAEDDVELCDGKEKVFKAVIKKINKKTTELLLKEIINDNTEPKYRINLIQGLLKGRKMDTVIQQSVELGVCCVIPVITDRTIPVIKDSFQGSAKVERWQKIARTAASQSRRGIIPSVKVPCLLKDLYKNSADSNTPTLVFWEGEKSGKIPRDEIKILIEKKSSINIIVGPEGGFNPEEIDLLKKKDVFVAGMGPIILRAETAAIAAVIISRMITGDFWGE